MTALTEEKIGELRKLHEAAFGGEWKADDYTGNMVWAYDVPKGPARIIDVRGWGYLVGKGHGALGLSREEAEGVQTATANLIAAARNTLPDLLEAASASVSHKARADGLEERVRELERRAAEEDRAQIKMLDERDGAEDALSKAYLLVTGRPAEWSNVFGYADALDDIELALHDARTAADDLVEIAGALDPDLTHPSIMAIVDRRCEIDPETGQYRARTLTESTNVPEASHDH